MTLEAAQELVVIGRLDEAQAMLRRILAAGADAAPAQWPRAAAALAMVLLTGRALPEAVTLAEQALSRAPHDPLLLSLYRAVGASLYRHSFWEDALPWLERASTLEPWDPGLSEMLERVRPRDYLVSEILDPVMGKALRRFSAREGASYIYVIDIVGTCNLRCPTCPVGNSDLGSRARGMMKPAMFSDIIQKIRAESPSSRPQVMLFNWGEPLLHPHLPDFIRQLREAGMKSHLSTNLNIKRGFEAVLRAEPDDLKISISGFSADSYARTHVGGDLALVQFNLREMRRIIDLHEIKTHVWVCQHLYRGTLAETEELASLCRELHFDFNPIEAFYMPLERLDEYLNGKPNPRDGGIIAELLVEPRKARDRRRAHQDSGTDCELRFNQTVINHDGSVALCCSVYDDDNMLGLAFLDHSHVEIERRKYDHPFCARCFKSGMAYTGTAVRPAH